jgi:DNA-directed RNA polymerase subunit omega
MPRRTTTLMDPPIEDLLDKVDSKFTLVALASKRARQINSYYNQLGDGMGAVVPPQVASVSGKPLTIAFEEVSGGKAAFHRPEPGEGEVTVDEAAAEDAVAEGVADGPSAAAPVGEPAGSGGGTTE